MGVIAQNTRFMFTAMIYETEAISVYRLTSFSVASLQSHELPVANATGEGAAAVFRDNPGYETLSMYPETKVHNYETPCEALKLN